jgi:hypothetical protein
MAKLVKKWPTDGKTVGYESLSQPVRRLFEQAYTLQRINEGKPLKWNGLPTPKCVAHVTLPFEERLTVESQEYEAERDRDMLDTIIGIAIHLGMEQGYRQAKEDMGPAMQTMEAVIKTLERESSVLADSAKKTAVDIFKRLKERVEKR